MLRRETLDCVGRLRIKDKGGRWGGGGGTVEEGGNDSYGEEDKDGKELI